MEPYKRLIAAIKNDNVESIDIKKLKKFRSPREKGGKIYHFAIEEERWNVVRYLMTTDINIHLKRHSGHTPLSLYLRENYKVNPILLLMIQHIGERCKEDAPYLLEWFLERNRLDLIENAICGNFGFLESDRPKSPPLHSLSTRHGKMMVCCSGCVCECSDPETALYSACYWGKIDCVVNLLYKVGVDSTSVVRDYDTQSYRKNEFSVFTIKIQRDRILRILGLDI